MLEEKTQHLMTDMGALLPLIVTNALNALGAIVILLVGLWLSGKANQLVVRAFGRTPHFDPMLRSFFGSLTRYLVLTVTVLAVLSEFGIQTTSLVAVLGAAGLAVGLALQGTLSNLAAGVMLLIFRPFKIGHKVQIGGSTGTVQELTLFWTELVTDDKVQIIVPNAGVWGQPLRNYSIYPALPHSGQVRFRIAEDLDFDLAIEKVDALVKADPHVLGDPAPSVFLDRNDADNALEIVANFSTAGDDVAAVKSDLIKAAQSALAAIPEKRGQTAVDAASAHGDCSGRQSGRQTH
jgi:small conductance mechanosensitive channel